MATKVCCVVLLLISFTGFLQAIDEIEMTSSPLLNYGNPLDKQAPENTAIKLAHNISFFGGQYDKIYISTDGVLSFETSVSYNPEVVWEEGIQDAAKDKPFMAPFIYKKTGNIDKYNYQGEVTYRIIYEDELKQDDDSYQYNVETLNFLNSYVKEAVLDVPSDFKASIVMVVTWKNVTDGAAPSSCKSTPDEPCKSATFQLVLMADKKNTYAIYNYYKMDIPYKRNYETGFNGGYGRGWFNVIPCHGDCSQSLGDSRVNDLPSLMGSDIKGRFILNVGGEIIVRGGCLPPQLRAGMLEMYPNTVGMFGGERLQVSGKCFKSGQPIYCKFGTMKDSPVTTGIMKNTMIGSCPVPILTTMEPILVQWSQDNKNWVSEAHLDIVLPEYIGLQKDVEEKNIYQWHTKDAKSITVQWDPKRLADRNGAMVTVNLLGYRENDDTQKVEFTKLATLGETNNRNGKMVVDTSLVRCESNCQAFNMGLFEISLTNNYRLSATQRFSIRYGPIPIGWFVNQELTSSMGDDWSDQKCHAWYEKDKENTAWIEQLDPCPCNLDQAVADFGRFQPGQNCNKFKGTKCHYHTSAVHCVRSVVPTKDGAGNQCCYDEFGNLIYSQLSYQGSTPDRSHAYGTRPYNKPNSVPSLSHWRHDVVPFYHCCLWNNYKLCDLYTKLRDTRDCKTYQVPGRANLIGDPHITTFDGQIYNFGGKGDFWLVKTESFRLQGRFFNTPGMWNLGELAKLSRKFLPTALTHLSLEGNGVVIAIQPAPRNSIIAGGLDMHVGKNRKFFLTSATQIQHYPGYTIFFHDLKQRKCTILLGNGVGVTLEAINDLLHLTVAMPPSMKINKGSKIGMGLMGMYDGVDGNDFVSNGGVVTLPTTAAPSIYKNFALTWAVTRKDSLMPVHYAVWGPTRFEPFFEYNNIPTDFDEAPKDSDIDSTCNVDEMDCKWDYRITGEKDIALATKQAHNEFMKTQNGSIIVRNCGLPDVGRNAKVSTNSFREGSDLTVTGCNGPNDVFSGEISIKCVTETVTLARSNQRDDYGMKFFEESKEYITHWVPKPEHVCTSTLGEEAAGPSDNTIMIIGICVGAVALIIIIVIVVVCIKKRKSSSSETPTGQPVPSKRRNHEGERGSDAAESMLSTNRNPVYKPSDQSVRIGSSV